VGNLPFPSTTRRETVIEATMPDDTSPSEEAAPSGPGFAQDLDARLRHALARLIAILVTRAWQLAADWRGMRPLLSRTTAHLTVLLLAGFVFLLRDAPFQAVAREWSSNPRPPIAASLVASSLTTDPHNIASMKEVEDASGLLQVTVRDLQGTGGQALGPALLTRRADPRTIIPQRPRRGVITYTVQPGDTVQSIADAFGLQPTTLMWSNPAVEMAPDLLRIGQELIILPVDGVYHTVEEGDTLESIAEKYKVEVSAIVELSYNHLEPPYTLEEGMKLIVPGGKKPYTPKKVTNYTGPVPQGARGTGRFQWPVLGVITQSYWWGHRALDIAAPTGSAVLAADGGFISFAGWTDIGYGYLIVVDHANGFATYYAHLSNIYVTVGQAVSRGQVIGAVGNTGNSTGPHLHFEVRYNGAQQNPWAYLP